MNYRQLIGMMAGAAGGGGGGGDFDFSTIQGANLTNWIAGRLITGVSDGDKVELPNDGVAGGSWTNGTAADRPAWKENIVNGRPVLRGVANTRLDLSGGPNLYSLLSVSAWTILAVAKVATAGAGVAFTSSGPIISDGNGGIFNISRDDNNFGAVHYTSGGSYATPVETPNYTIDQFHLIEYRREGGDNKIKMDDGSYDTETAGNLHGSFGGTPRMFNNNSGEQFLGDIAELLIWNIALDGTDTTAARAALASMYGVPA